MSEFGFHHGDIDQHGTVVVVQLRYGFRVYLSDSRCASWARSFGCARVVFNDALRVRGTARVAGLPSVTSAELSKQLTASKKTSGRAWLSEVSSVVLQQSLRDLDIAYRNFFGSLKGKRPKTGPPRFKSRRDNRQAVRFTADAGWRITDSGKLRPPKIGDVRVKWSRSLPSVPSTVGVVKDAAGRYFASFVVETDPDDDVTRMPQTDAVVGIDLGLTHIAVLSDGRKFDGPRFLRRAEKKLKRAQQALSRKTKGSKNQEKARIEVARDHGRVADARREFHHRLSTESIRENRAVAVENLAVKGFARTRLAKSVHDAGWSSFVTMLEYEATRYGRAFHRIGRFEPTSQACSHCGVKDGPKPLNVREWTRGSCGSCGAVLDRDVNAAVNVAKAAGLAVSARGAQAGPILVPARRVEAGTHPEPRPTKAGRTGTALL